MGIVSLQKLKEIRSYVIVGAFVIAAIVTPLDVMSRLLLAIPLWLLYEVGRSWRRAGRSPLRLNNPVRIAMNNLPLRYFQIVLFLLAAVPCGIPFRYQPNPVFPSELAAFIAAALLVFGAVFVPRQRRSSFALPWASLIWFALAGVISVQYWLLKAPYMSEHTVPVLYLICAGFSAWALIRAKASYGGEALMEALAWGLVAGTLFNNNGVGTSQLIDLFQNGWRLIYGHIGQKNAVWPLPGLGAGGVRVARRKAETAAMGFLAAGHLVGVVDGVVKLAFGIPLCAGMAAAGGVHCLARA